MTKIRNTPSDEDPTTIDPEVTHLVNRAKALRVSIEELCRHAGETSVTVWRWQKAYQAPWARREAFLVKAEAYLDSVMEEYEALRKGGQDEPGS